MAFDLDGARGACDRSGFLEKARGRARWSVEALGPYRCARLPHRDGHALAYDLSPRADRDLRAWLAPAADDGRGAVVFVAKNGCDSCGELPGEFARDR